MNTYFSRYLLLVFAGFFLGTTALSSMAQPASGKKGGPASPRSSKGHSEHQTPEGWKFTWPKGDPAKGREIFVKLECYSCHEIKGEKFPAPGGEVGPELSVMGPLHDAEYFAEAIINPSAAIEKSKGYEATDGSSKMPSYNELVTVQDLIDLVAYLKGLKPPVDAPASQGSRPGSIGGQGKHGRH
jgi:mono/diheme cytochrome c family protein